MRGITHNPETIITDISPSRIKDLTFVLNENDAWYTLAHEFNVEFSIFSQQDVSRIRRESDPSWKFLHFLGMRCCTVGLLCQILRRKEMYDALAILVDPEPAVITQHPGDSDETKYVYKDTELRLECRATGLPPPSYLWFHGNQELADQTTNTLVVNGFSEEHEGEYHCRVYQQLESRTVVLQSDVMNVELQPTPPVIEQHPVPQLVCKMGESINLLCTATGHPPPQYEWYRDNNRIIEGDSNILNIPCVKLKHGGSYRCYVKNKSSEVWSDSCKLSVVPCDAFPGSDVPRRLIAKEKVALLIGNDTYCHWGHLKTPRNDVVTMAEILSNIGFRVMAFHNLTLHEMRCALNEFCSLLHEESYAFFSFGGHGFEIQDKFMLPIDVPSYEKYLRRDCLCEKEVLREISKKKPSLLFMLLDMCLEVPRKEQNPHIYEEIPETYEFKPLRNQTILYTTTSNTSAYEKVKGTNSNYVSHLKKYLGQDLPIRRILEIVKLDFAGDKQMPYDCSNVAIDIYFTDQVQEIESTRKKYRALTTLPDIGNILRFNKIGITADVAVRPHRGCFLNSLDVILVGLGRWGVEVQLASKPEPEESKRCRTVDQSGQCMQFDEVLRKNLGIELGMEQVAQEDKLIVTIHNLQRVTIPLLMSLFVKEPTTEKLVDTAFLDLEYPLIAKARWWFKPK